jgi:hypothetical protein
LTGGIVAAIVVGVIIFLLSIPLDLSFYLRVREKLEFRFSLRWLFSLVKKEFGRKKRAAKKRAERSWAFVDLLRIRGLLPKLLRLLRDVFKHIRIRYLAIDFTIGLDDPADTALLVGSLWLPAFLLSPSLPHSMRLQPSFDEGPIFQGYAHVVLRMRPIQLLPAIARFACSRVALGLLGGLLSRRWKRKR